MNTEDALRALECVDPAAIRNRLEELERERQMLRTLLRAKQRRASTYQEAIEPSRGPTDD